MRTTTTSALLASMLAIGCAPLGDGGPGRTRTGVDAGAGDSTCDTSNVTAKSGDFDFTSSASLTGLPTSCWTLDGKLTVDSSITSLAKLGDLRAVGDLVIKNSGLTTIDTPTPLAVSGSIDIEMNTKLADISNLTVPADSTCGTYLTAVTLSGNSALTSMGALNQVSCVIGATAITNNVKLTDLDLSNAVRLEGGLTISGNTAATTLELTALQSITAPDSDAAALTIQNNAALTSLGSWTALQFVHGGLTIDSNAALPSLAGVITASASGAMGTGIMIEGALAITNNAKLTEVGEFDHLSYADSISVSNNTAMTYCEAREIGCCVVDSNPPLVTTATITGNKTNQNTTCASSSWCYAANGNECHNNYTGYQMSQGIR